MHVFLLLLPLKGCVYLEKCGSAVGVEGMFISPDTNEWLGLQCKDNGSMNHCYSCVL